MIKTLIAGRDSVVGNCLVFSLGNQQHYTAMRFLFHQVEKKTEIFMGHYIILIKR